MGAVERSDNVTVRNKKKNSVSKQKFSKPVGTRNNNNYPPSLLSHPFRPFSPPATMRPRPPFPMGRMPPPGMGPMPPPGVRLPPPPPLFRNRVPPPGRMGPRGPLPPMPPMRPRPPLMGPPPLMRPPPPMMRPRRFPPRLPPPMLPPNKLRQLKHKIHAKKNNKKKHQVQTPADLFSPWVTGEIKGEFDKKDKLFSGAKESNKVEDWHKFKEQRAKCDKLFKTAKLDYISKHPEEVFGEEYSGEEISEHAYADQTNHCESQRQFSDNFCDACERAFPNAVELKYHMQQHRVCGIDGCKFVAHEKILEKHITMQHVSGLYYRMTQTKTAEDIAKWREERRKKYPTKENIEKRQKQQEEMMNRGERIQAPSDRFGKNNKQDVQPQNLKRLNNTNSKFPQNKRSKRRKTRRKPEIVITSLLDDRSFWNGNLPPFPGTSDIYENKDENGVASIIDDSEWLDQHPETPKVETNNAIIKPEVITLEPNNIVIKQEITTIETNALGALMGAYGSSDESENETVEPKPEEVVIKMEVIENKPTEDTVELVETKVKLEVQAGDEAPEEQKIIKQDNNEQNLEKNDNKPETSQQQNSKPHNRKRRRNKSKEKTEKPKEKIEKPKETVTKLSDQIVVQRRVTLLERLLASEIRHERNVILQCVRYVVQNNFFQNNENSRNNSNETPDSSEAIKEGMVVGNCDNEQIKEIIVDKENTVDVKQVE